VTDLADTGWAELSPESMRHIGPLMVAADRLEAASIPGAREAVFVIPATFPEPFRTCTHIWGHPVLVADVPSPMVAVAAVRDAAVGG
jgi:hypothetical protein